jgi:membrane-anchored protein YejM (alkaline phosphatase superfamily)
MVETGNKFHDNVGKKVAWAHWFTFFNIVALCLISLRYIVYSGLADTPLGIAYQFVSLIGHFSFLSAVVFIILLFPLAFIITNNLLYRLISIAVATTAITFLIVDTQIFRLYQFHLNPFIWQFLQKP